MSTGRRISEHLAEMAEQQAALLRECNYLIHLAQLHAYWHFRKLLSDGTHLAALSVFTVVLLQAPDRSCWIWLKGGTLHWEAQV